MTSHTLYMTSQSHFMTSFLSIYDITATAFMTSDTLHRTSLPGLSHLVPYPCDITDNIFVNTYQLYLTSNRRCRGNTTTISEIRTSICVSVWSHTQCIDDKTHTVLMTWHLLYLWHIMHCIWHLTHNLWHHNTLSITSVYYISYQTDYIWQHFHCISVITPRLSII